MNSWFSLPRKYIYRVSVDNDIRVTVRSTMAKYDILTHWGLVTHKCVNKLTIIGSDNGLSPDRHQAIIWTNAEILLIEPLATNFSEIFIGIHTFSFTKMHLKLWSGKCRPFCPGINVLRQCTHNQNITWVFESQINQIYTGINFRIC